MEEKKFIVYEHVSKNGKRYIGITSQSPHIRWRNGKGYVNNIHFYNSIVKNGWNSFEHNVLFEHISEDEAKRLEKELIKKFNTTNPKFGYNVTRGGDTRKPCSEETKQKIREKLIGKKRSIETRIKMSDAAKKRPKRTLTDEWKQKISTSLIGNKRAVGNSSNSKKVAMCDESKNIIKIYENSYYAGKEIGCCPSGINRACHENEFFEDLSKTKYGGKYKGVFWFYVDENNKIKSMLKTKEKPNNRNCAVKQYSLDRKLIKEYKTILQAASSNNISKGELSRRLSKKQSVQYKGYIWEKINS